MHWGSTWQITHHAGLNPLCWCCCDKEAANPGGSQFEGQQQGLPPKLGSNSFLRVRPGNPTPSAVAESTSTLIRDSIPVLSGPDRESHVPWQATAPERQLSAESDGSSLRPLQSVGTVIPYQDGFDDLDLFLLLVAEAEE